MNAADVEKLRGTVRGQILRPGDDNYDAARVVFNAAIDRRPALIVRCAGAADVIQSVNFARTHDLIVAVRAGGHHVAGFATCDDGIVIDLSRMKGIHVRAASRTVRVEPGVTWGELNDELQTFGLAAAGGYVSITGIAGLTLGGGLGWMVRKHGLALDNLLSADCVTAGGRLLTASPMENDDLFWGLRGASGNFGIVTSFEFKVHPAGVVLGGLVVHPLAKARDALRFWRDYESTVPEEISNGALLFTFPDDPSAPEVLRGAPIVGIGGVYVGDLEDGERALRPLRAYGPPAADLFQPMPYNVAQRMADFLWPPNMHNYWKSAFLTGLTDGAIDVILDFYARVPSRRTVVVLEHDGDGAFDRVGEFDTAFGQRRWPYNLVVTTMWETAREADVNIRWTRELFDALRPYTADAVYLNYIGDEGEARVAEAYGIAKHERLVALKNKYDPANLFRMNQNIRPAPVPARLAGAGT